MASWRDAVQQAPQGVRLLVEVTAGAKAARFPDGYNPWRNRIGVRVRAPAQEGRANQEVLATVAAFLGVPTGGVLLESGAADSRKTLLLGDITVARVQDLLRAVLLEDA